MPDRDFITVSELNYFVNRVINAEELLQYVPVVGEVSSVSVKQSHCYFVLKDEKAQINAAFFSYNGKYIPKNGEKVLIKGRVDYYQTRGSISLLVYEVIPFGVGLLHAQLLALKEKLEKEGLFAETHKKKIPEFPNRIGIITSIKGAAIQDILSTLQRYDSRQKISIIDVRVQGDKCVEDVVTALQVSDTAGFDVIILTRGGGSFEDLYPFNDERIVRAIYYMNTPVITAVGHETDYTLCDYVSDYRAITPTAAAEKVAINTLRQKETLMRFSFAMRDALMVKIEQNKLKLYRGIQSISQNAQRKIDKERYSFRILLQNIKNKTLALYEQKKYNYDNKISILESVNPLKLLNRGYFRIVFDQKIVNDLSEIKQGNTIVVVGKKEIVHAEVIKKETL